ncbi:retrieval of early ER protein Rer1 [Yarrowia lipolytica]|jgi:hypothetical protein|uniref:Protein RER1 n=2 Tax=Yarrowia lipolytica TaxID=4952 RepID=Q6CFF7_YARLI|nr:YALI0B07425p [Yarrowia lipolytica CLIB122]AOW01356.1 hypothetical protein YALI1_B09568g [Yarrowia lipolytica]KAB8281822.1 retrieval of early ER protein Rer1 [Yarrowia lipolytica]KAE8171593.1 retrieval of early ER protein Rer1 [Yarrowia lipolytica]KAJ8052207.1 retrieval of early ER protein Rer1 [Yarrowia lipolytica]QNP97279.1 Protein rer1 [Yarrowia lipolytica]|eukprot:XP_500605.1 YALI0B07425p [Yarrowia lipolytica CLIB122]
MDEPSSSPLDIVSVRFRRALQVYQHYVDKCVPHKMNRWVAFGVLLTLFMVRIIMAQGWYVVCYTLGIYLLNLFLAFLQPKFDPSLKSDLEMEDAEEGQLPTEEPEASSSSEEFKPFIRRLPEFKFWHSATRATVISLVCSFIPAFDIPVFWPILLIYFFILFSLTMKKQIQHMIKYRYLPFDIGKKTYK